MRPIYNSYKADQNNHIAFFPQFYIIISNARTLHYPSKRQA